MIAKPRRSRQRKPDRQAKQSKAIKKRVKSESRNIRASERNKSLKWDEQLEYEKSITSKQRKQAS